MPKCPPTEAISSFKASLDRSKRTKIYRCGKWVFRSTKFRQGRGLVSCGKRERIKRKWSPSSSPPSAHSCTGDNYEQLPATMSISQDDTKMWAPPNTEKFLTILIESKRKEMAETSKVTSTFNPIQWVQIKAEMERRVGRAGYTIPKMQQKLQRLKIQYKAFLDIRDHTGLGWDPINQTVIAPEPVWQNYVQAHPDARQFRRRGLPNYELLAELFENTMATGVFAQASTLGPPDSDEDCQEILHGSGGRGKGLDWGTSSGSKGKRKSDGGGVSDARKRKKESKKELAWERVALAQEAKHEFYRNLNMQNTRDECYSIKACLDILNTFTGYVDPVKLAMAANKFAEKKEWRQMWIEMAEQMRLIWLQNL